MSETLGTGLRCKKIKTVKESYGVSLLRIEYSDGRKSWAVSDRHLLSKFGRDRAHALDYFSRMIAEAIDRAAR